MQTVLRPGQSIGPFRLERLLAMGGMAEVWAAVGPLPSGEEAALALKIINQHTSEEDDAWRSFRDEVRLSTYLRHENVIGVYEGLEVGGRFIQTMELIDGIDLRRTQSRLAENDWRFPVPLALYVGRCVARALAYVHLRKDAKGHPLNVVHRDISPHNIMLARDGRVKLLDFGIAKDAHRLVRTKVGLVKGKVSYMSPEQTLGDKLDHRSDIFSTGVVLWELLAGERLFSSDYEAMTMDRIHRLPIPRLDDERLRPELPTEAAVLVDRMLERPPSRRPQTMVEVERALNKLLVRHFEPDELGPSTLARWVGRVLDSRPRQGTARLPSLGGVDTEVSGGPKH